jgi:hypothetical protein
LAAGVGAAGLATSAEAQIIPITLSNVHPNFGQINAGVSSSSYETINNWLGSNTGKIELYNGYYSLWGLDGDPSSGINLQFSVNALFSSANPKNFGVNTPIDGSSLFSDSSSDTAFRYGSAVAPTWGSGSYMGFRFGSSGNYNYGWLEVTWNSTLSQFQILSGAYESSLNTQILAGATGSTPVPESTASGGLMGLLLGGAALRQWRKSRNKADVAEKALSA